MPEDINTNTTTTALQPIVIHIKGSKVNAVTTRKIAEAIIESTPTNSFVKSVVKNTSAVSPSRRANPASLPVFYIDLGGSISGLGQASRFRHANKAVQLNLLHQSGITTTRYPFLTSDRDVEALESLGFDTNLTLVRPIRHKQGVHYDVYENLDEKGENLAFAKIRKETGKAAYVAQIFRKTDEFRVIYSYGERLCVLKKQPVALCEEALNKDDRAKYYMPWNHTQGSEFQTVNNVKNDLLRFTSFYSKASPFLEKWCLESVPLLAFDVLVKRDSSPGKVVKYAVSEVNFAPSLTIPQNLSLFKDRVLTKAEEFSRSQ